MRKPKTKLTSSLFKLISLKKLSRLSKPPRLPKILKSRLSPKSTKIGLISRKLPRTPRRRLLQWSTKSKTTTTSKLRN